VDLPLSVEMIQKKYVLRAPKELFLAWFLGEGGGEMTIIEVEFFLINFCG